MPLDAVKLSPSISGHNGDNGERSIAIPKSVGVADSSPLSAGAPPCNDCNERGFWAIDVVLTDAGQTHGPGPVQTRLSRLSRDLDCTSNLRHCGPHRQGRAVARADLQPLPDAITRLDTRRWAMASS